MHNAYFISDSSICAIDYCIGESSASAIACLQCYAFMLLYSTRVACQTIIIIIRRCITIIIMVRGTLDVVYEILLLSSYSSSA